MVREMESHRGEGSRLGELGICREMIQWSPPRVLSKKIGRDVDEWSGR